VREYLRPWKLFSLLAGIVLLIAGSFYYHASDWDVGISVVMALFTYLTAASGLRTIVKSLATLRFDRPFVWAIWWWYWSVDGCYWVYNTLLHHQMIRYENFLASTGLYFLCGLIWWPQCSLRELLSPQRIRQALSDAFKPLR
jgi:hypothetical protein